MARSDSLPARARRAYEWGRFRAGVRSAWPVLPIVAIALFARDRHATAVIVGVALFALSVVFTWWGGSLARAVRPGLLVALVPLVFPIVFVAAATGDVCSRCALGAAQWSACLVTCFAAGITAGVFVGLRAARLPRGRVGFVVGAALLAALGGSLGCGLLGASGILGMLAGLAIGSIPVVVVAAVRR